MQDQKEKLCGLTGRIPYAVKLLLFDAAAVEMSNERIGLLVMFPDAGDAEAVEPVQKASIPWALVAAASVLMLTVLAAVIWWIWWMRRRAAMTAVPRLG